MITVPDIIRIPRLVKIIKAIGNMSFSVYLLHMVVIDFIGKISIYFNFWGGVVMILVMILGSLIISWLCHTKIIKPVEKKFHKWMFT